LLAANGNIFNLVPGIDGQPVTFGNLSHFFLGCGQIKDTHHFGCLSAQYDVLGNGKGCHQHEMLMNHTDAVLDGNIGVTDVDFQTIDADFAVGGTIETVKTVYQGCFTGPVFTQE